MKSEVALLGAVLLGLTCTSLRAQPAPLTTSQDCKLAVPASRISSAGLPGATNLTGSNFLLSAVMPSTLYGGGAALANSQQWVSRYNAGPASSQNAGYAMALRGDGSIVVAGPSLGQNTSDDFVTLAYAPDGTALWTNRYDGSAHGEDNAYCVATAPSGDVWVVGQSARSATNFLLTDVVVLRYSSNGNPVWTHRYTSFETNGVWPSALAVDSAGNAFVKLSVTWWQPSGGGTPVEDAIVKYDAQGNLAWTKHYLTSAPDSAEALYDAEAMAMDGAGNLLVGGESYEFGSSVVKYAGDGTPVWTNHVPFPLVDGIGLLCPDRAGNVIIAGEHWSNNQRVCVVIKCSADGASLWTNVLAGPAYDGGNMPQIAPDPAGNVFVLAGMTGAPSPGLYQIMKVGSDGLPSWTNRNVIFGNTNGNITGSIADSAGNLLLIGDAPAPGATYRDYVAGKYSADGLPLWTTRFDGAAGLRDDAFAMVFDAAGNLYVTGQSERSLGKYDLTTVKFADRLVYTPPPGFTGSDAITYTLTDNFGNSATGSVAVVVTPGSFHFNLSPAATRLTDGGFQGQLDGVPGNNGVVIEASTDLIHWQPILTNPPTAGSVQFLDSAATGLPRRFYRAFQAQ